MRRKTKEEIDEFIIQNDKPRIAACTLGCGQVIKDQLIEYKIHECPLEQCVTWMTKCKKCRAMLSPTGEILYTKEEIYREWDKHNRKVNRILGIDDK